MDPVHGRTQQVSYAGVLSTLMVLTFGVPQSSVLGLLLFLLYTAELFDVIASAGLTAHSYADDTQVYISVPATSASTTVRFIACVERIDARMSSNRLRMNADKTHLLWLGTRQQLNKLSVNELQPLGARVSFSGQGCPQDVKSQDRDETETFQKTYQDRSVAV